MESNSTDEMKKWVQSKLFVDFERLPKSASGDAPVRRFTVEELDRDVEGVKAQFTRAL